MNWLFFVVLGIFVIGLIWGLKAGFVRVIYSLVSSILIFVLTILLCPVVQDWLFNNEKVYTTINTGVESFVDLTAIYENLTAEKNHEVANAEQMIDTPQEEQACENVVEQVLESLGLPSVIRNAIIANEGFTELIKQNADQVLRGQLDSLEVYVCKVFTKTIINALGFVITFLVVFVAVTLVCRILDILVKLPFVREVNKIAGIAAGLAEALLVIWLLFALITMFGYTEFGQNLLSQINDNAFLTMLYRANILSGRIFRDTMNV